MTTTRLTIAHVGHRGDGVAEGRFVPYTLPGEVVEVEGDEERAAPATILSPSPDRVTPPCPHFGTCGGCALQHWADAPYLALGQLFTFLHFLFFNPSRFSSLCELISNCGI